MQQRQYGKTSKRQYVCGDAHANSAEGFNDRVRRIIAGVFHHISPEHADLYFNRLTLVAKDGDEAGDVEE
jgi:hypothetical protein